MAKAKETITLKEKNNLLPKELLSKTVLDFIPDSLAIIDTKGRIEQVSRNAVRMFNLATANDAIGKTIFDFIHNSEHQKVIVNMKKVLSGWNGSSRTYQLLKNDEEVFWGEVQTSLVTDVDGSAAYFVITISDAGSCEIVPEFNQSNDLLHLLSHELRQPVNAIIGFSELIALNIHQQGNCNEEKLKKYNKIITQQSVFLQNIIDQILGLARVNDLQINNVLFDVKSELEELFDVFQLRMKQLNKLNIDLQVVNTPSNINSHIYNDLTKLKQVFSNILFNALKHTSSGTIRFGYHSYNNNSFTFFVSDTGEGIPIENQNFIFNKYTQLNSAHAPVESVGLGLSLTKKIIKLMGGSIWVESQVGHGSTFYFSIPVNS